MNASGGNQTEGSGWDDFAPVDYTDGRSPLDWATKYPSEAQKRIRLEAAYVVGIFIVFLIGVFILLYFATIAESKIVGDEANPSDGDLTNPTNRCFLGYVCAWVAGTVGGSLFGLKWMYHSVAKGLWHEDRRLWRILTPHVSGAVSLFTMLLISSGLLQIFDARLIERHGAVLGFGFLVGYFSDKALAKLAETADTLFGVTKRR